MPPKKQITKGHEARMRIKAGIDKACDAVRPTLGAVGMAAMIEVPGLDPIECDDGVTILKNLEFEDKYENLGLQKLRKAALRTSSEGGDGTATTTVLTAALVNEAFKEIANDSSKIREVRERLDAGLKNTLEELSKIKREVKEEDIEKIATISSLDPEVAKLIAEIIKEVGVNGVVTVERGSKLGYAKEVVKGARFGKGYISPFFINDAANGRVVLEDAYIVLVDRRVSTNEQIMPLLASIGTGKHILFIATDVDGVALGTLALNARRGTANIACVQNPYNATPGRDFLFDMAALTGATVISEEMGMRLDDADVKLCGRAEKIIITQNSTTIIGGNSSDYLQDRIKEIESKIESTTSEYEKGMLEDRLAALTGGIGVIRVGAYTDTEFHAKKYKFENAINATQAALQEGILPGGGVALALVSKNITEPIFARSLSAPLRQMGHNAGLDGGECVYYTLRFGKGYDFKTKQIVDMFDAGIIDPFKVTRLALESATAIASSLIAIETAIVTEDEPDAKTRG
jgi:chaperonin GroEL